jgi:hypothetical protein
VKRGRRGSEKALKIHLNLSHCFILIKFVYENGRIFWFGFGNEMEALKNVISFFSVACRLTMSMLFPSPHSPLKISSECSLLMSFSFEGWKKGGKGERFIKLLRLILLSRDFM